jgi:uncharacterized protein YcfJ
MKQWILIVLLIGTLVPMTTVSGGEAAPEAAQYARVLTIEPVVWNTTTPVYQHECQPQPQTFIPGNDIERYAPTVIGAVAGGLVGSQLGHKNSRPLTTILGGVIGATIGNLAGEHQRRQTNPPAPRYSDNACLPQTADAGVAEVEYDVTYYFDGQKFTATLAYVPDNWIRVWPDGTLAEVPENANSDTITRDDRYDSRRHSNSLANQ